MLQERLFVDAHERAAHLRIGVCMFRQRVLMMTGVLSFENGSELLKESARFIRVINQLLHDQNSNLLSQSIDTIESFDSNVPRASITWFDSNVPRASIT